MKSLLAILALFAVVTARSQTATPAETDMDILVSRRLMQQPANQSLLGIQPEKPNEIRRNNISYSGIGVQLIKTDNPLQLINPAAPIEYGSSEDNVAWDPITGQVSGLKLFSIQF